MRIAQIVAPSLLVSLLLGTGCSLTAPDGSADGVQRCATTADCPKSTDNRYAYACVRASEQSEQSEQVCEPRKAIVQCNMKAAAASASTAPEGGNDYISYLLRAAQEINDAKKTLCPEDKMGKFGCPPKDGACSEGKVTKVGNLEFCSDAKSPTIPAGGEATLLDADIRDQYCRWYFCDADVVCNNGQCVPCDPTKTFENGGCRTMYRNGEISPVQVDLQDKCNKDGGLQNKDIVAADKIFGDFPPAADTSL